MNRLHSQALNMFIFFYTFGFDNELSKNESELTMNLIQIRGLNSMSESESGFQIEAGLYRKPAFQIYRYRISNSCLKLHLIKIGCLDNNSKPTRSRLIY